MEPWRLSGRRARRIAAPAIRRGNALGAERVSAQFAGGEVDNWHAYALNDASHAPVRVDCRVALYAYLRNGWHPDHGTARGPMAEVVSNLAYGARQRRARHRRLHGRHLRARRSRTQDSRRCAGASRIGTPRKPIRPARRSMPRPVLPAMRSSRPLPYGGVNLALSTAVTSPDPRNLANIVLAGRSAAVAGRAQSDHAGLRRQHRPTRRCLRSSIILRARFSKRPALERSSTRPLRDARRQPSRASPDFAGARTCAG